MSRLVRYRVKTNRWLIRHGFPSDWFLIPLAAVIGSLAGVVALAFDRLVHLSSEGMFGRLYETHLFFAGERYLWLIVLPTFGGLLVGVLSYYARGKAGGHGIPDVIHALGKRQGVLPRRSIPFKALTSALTIGSGGSAGVEGPIIHIGSAVGSAVGQTIKVGREHMHALVGCGAAAGMAAIFNAPIAGFIFALEVLLRDFSLRTIIPILIASVFGTAVSRAYLQDDTALFMVPQVLHLWAPTFFDVMLFIPLGIFCGLVGVTFTRAMIYSDQLRERAPIHPIFKPALGGAMLGVTGIAFVLMYPNLFSESKLPAFYGNGYPIITALFDPQTYTHVTVLALIAILAFKIIGTCMTIGSGGSGGVLAPSLFMGAALGGMFGLLLQNIGLAVQPAAFALVGMAGMFAAVVHCPLTSFLLVFELTTDYQLILPVMLVSILATTCAQILYRDSVYGYWLKHMGMLMGIYSDTSMLRRLYVSQVKLEDAYVVHEEDPGQRLIDLAAQHRVTDFVVHDHQGVYVGMVVGEDVRETLLEREAVPLLIVEELMRANVPTVTRDHTLDDVLKMFAQHDVASLPVVDADMHVVGMITRSQLMQRYQKVLEGN